ncbi:hypothetical protein ACFLVW_02535 [Chloroflexota bacterium]
MPRFRISAVSISADRAWTTIALASVGAIIGAVIILYPYRFVGLTSQTQVLIAKPEFVLWLSINCVLTAFSAVIILPLWRSVIQFRKHFIGNKLEIVLSLAILLVLLSVPTVPTFLDLLSSASDKFPQLPLQYFSLKILILTIFFGIFIGLLIATGIWLVNAALRSRFENIKPSKEDVSRYLCYREYLQRYLWMGGVTLGLGILAAGALSKLHITVGSQYPSLFVLVYGAYLTILLMLVYIPAYVSLTAVGRQLRDTIFPLPSLNSKSWTDAYLKRKHLEELLQLRITAGQNLRENIAILAPLGKSGSTT